MLKQILHDIEPLPVIPNSFWNKVAIEAIKWEIGSGDEKKCPQTL